MTFDTVELALGSVALHPLHLQINRLARLSESPFRLLSPAQAPAGTRAWKPRHGSSAFRNQIRPQLRWCHQQLVHDPVVYAALDHRHAASFVHNTNRKRQEALHTTIRSRR